MDDKKIIDLIVSVVDNNDLILTLLQLDDFNPKQFLFFKNWFFEREKDPAKLNDQKVMIEAYCDLYMLFPYGEGLREWLNSSLTNEEIVHYRGDGIELDTALELKGKSNEQ